MREEVDPLADDFFPEDYPEPPEATSRCHYCGKRTNDEGHFGPNPFREGVNTAIVPCCMRRACMKAFEDDPHALVHHPASEVPS